MIPNTDKIAIVISMIINAVNNILVFMFLCFMTVNVCGYCWRPFVVNCLKMIQELKEYRRSPADVLMQCMSERLDKSLETYNKELTDSSEYLARRKDPANTVRRMTK